MSEKILSSGDGQIQVPVDTPSKTRDILGSLNKDTRKRWLLVGGVGIGLMLALATVMSRPKEKRPVVTAGNQVVDTTPKGLSSQSDWKAQTGAELQDLRRTVAEQNAVQREMLARLEQLRAEAAKAQQPAAPARAAGLDTLSIPAPPPPPKSERQQVPVAPTAPPSSALAGGAVNQPQPPLAPAAAAPQARTAARGFLPSTSPSASPDGTTTVLERELVANEKAGLLLAGSFAGATLLSGVEAFTGGTAQSQPQPVVVRVDENAILPNAARYDIQGCHILLGVYGDLSSERVFGRTSTLTCTAKDGEMVVSAEVEGNLVDSDGKVGVRGELIDRQGAKLARSLLAGFAQGMASAFGTAQSTMSTGIVGGIGMMGTTQTISGSNAVAAAGYSGANSAAKSLADFYLKQAEATMPVIAVDSARKVSVLFTKSVSLKFEPVGAYKQKPPAKPKSVEVQ